MKITILVDISAVSLAALIAASVALGYAGVGGWIGASLHGWIMCYAVTVRRSRWKRTKNRQKE